MQLGRQLPEHKLANRKSLACVRYEYNEVTVRNLFFRGCLTLYDIKQ